MTSVMSREPISPTRQLQQGDQIGHFIVAGHAWDGDPDNPSDNSLTCGNV
ncbi:hypothetical protein ACODT5_45340 [Streptomyces sp. 5.8]